MDTVGTPLLWIGFIAFVAAMLALDLGVFHRKAHSVSVKEAAIWSAVWIGLSLIFNVIVFWQWGSDRGEAFLTGYLIEKALSVDNLFVFYVIFSAFAIAPQYQHRLLFWGIIGALLTRAAMVWGGTAMLSHFHWAIYVFGGVLIWTGLKMLIRHEGAPEPEKSRLYKLITRILPTSAGEHAGRFFVRENGALKATKLLLVLIFIELTDVVFAIDSIMAIFAISRDPFIVFTSNVFAVLGLRSLFFVLAGMAQRFEYLQPGLALIMLFVGIKMAISDWVHVPVVVSLLVVSSLLAGSIIASVVKSRRLKKEGQVRGIEQTTST